MEDGLLHDVAIVGTGFGGIGMAIALKRAGIDSFVVLERAGDVGGTWRDNHYPGCACDIPSMLYSFSFEPNPDWTRVYPSQPEIWAYLRRCTEKYGIRPHIRFNSEVLAAVYDETRMVWTIRTSNGDTTVARVLVCAMGGLSNPQTPRLPGLERFAGTVFHSAQWNHEYSLANKRVAVIGTGASAVQFIPEIAPAVARLLVFQRTPPWIIPRSDAPISDVQRALRRHLPGYAWLVRKLIYWSLEFRALGFTVAPKILGIAEAIARRHLASHVRDPALRRTLTPHYRMGCKRVLISDTYYPALQRPNVAVVTAPIREVRERSIITADGTEHAIDTIIFGTGFRAQEFISPVNIVGRGGVELTDAWKDAPQAYLGINVAGFPNLHFLVGPNTGLGHNSMVLMIEAQIRYVMSALRLMRERKVDALDVRTDVQSSFNDALQRRMSRTVWTSGCTSWYLDEHGKNTTLWPGFTFVYRLLTRRVRPERYDLDKEGITN